MTHRRAGGRPSDRWVIARSAASSAMRGTGSAGRGVGSLARDVVEGAVRAAGEIGGETGAFARDAVIGVVEGTGQVVRVAAPAVREVVIGGIRGSRDATSSSEPAGRDVVEGAIIGAAAVGMDTSEAVAASVEGAVTATEEIDGDYEEAVNAAVGGVVSGVSAIEGDVAAATRNAAHILVARAAESEYADTAIEDVASTAVEAALRESGRTADVDEKVIAAAALGAVEAAYQVGQTEGDAARHSVISGIFRPQAEIAPALRRQLSEIGQRMSEELPQGRAAWRGAAMFRAVRLLIRAGGIDLAAALAYFATLSFFPVVALLILGLSVLGDSEGFREKFTETLIYYFPTSSELIRGAVDALINGSLAMGLVSIISLVVGASGMISSASRTVNRVFGTEQGRAVQTTIAEMAVATLVVILFLLSVGLTVALHAVVGFGEGIIESAGGVSAVAAVALALISTTLPAFVTAGIFAVVYRRLPNVRVEWRDAAFGAIVAIILFELGKHLFFWFTNLAAHRNAIYGPLASIVILLMWTYVGGLVFLYGAALTRVAGELRPRTIAPTEEAATGSG